MNDCIAETTVNKNVIRGRSKLTTFLGTKRAIFKYLNLRKKVTYKTKESKEL